MLAGGAPVVMPGHHIDSRGERCRFAALSQDTVADTGVVPLTSRLHLEGLPGTVRLDRRVTQLPKASVANAYGVQKVLRADFLECLGSLPLGGLAALEEGLRLDLDL